MDTQQETVTGLNLYQRLMMARIEFHSAPIKKSGYNDYGKYNYFELADFVVPLMNIFAKHRILPLVSFTKDEATLRLTDMDKPTDCITFTSPMAGAALKATHEIQQMGAVQTYQRRYLYIMALDIVEHDAIDSAPPRDPLDLMDEAPNLKALQDLFAEQYSAAKGNNKRREVIKARYEDNKLRFVTQPEKPTTDPVD